MRSMVTRTAIACGFALTLGLAPALRAQDAAPLTLDRLFVAGEFFGRGVGQVRWLEEGGYTTLERSEAVRGGRDIVRHDPATGGQEVMVSASLLVPAGAERPLPVQGYSWSEDGTKLLVFTNTRRVWRSNTRGDYWVLDLGTKRLRQLGVDRPESSLMYAKFSPDGSRVGYVSDNDLFVEDVASGTVTRLTSDGSRTILNGRFDWVYEEEFFLGSRAGADGWRWSPDGTRIAYWQLDASGVREFLMINNTDSLYSYVIPVQYPKAGTTNSAGRMGVVPAAGGATTWMKIDHDPRNNYIARMEFAANSDEIVMQHLNRLQNTLQVMLGNTKTGVVKTVVTERDTAWVDAVDDLFWLDDGARFTWVSERDGWRRLYMVNRDGSGMKPITPPAADMISLQVLDEDGGWVYYMASPDDPTRRYLWRAPLDGSMRAERVSPADQRGTHGYNMSPDAKWAFHTFSTFDTPPVASLVELPSHRVARVMADNAELADKVAAMKQRPTEFFRVDIGDGIELDMWMMKPNDFDPSKKYPALLYVYGGPWGTTVVDRWGGIQTLWYQYLTEQGYLVISVDNRGTPAPRGREWRKIIYQKDGIILSYDQANAVRTVTAERPYVDAERIAIWGWSGGGVSTLNAMFRYPDVYHTGMAVASVPDLKYYDTIYQERYMGLPEESPDAYRESSAINFAQNLEGNLLIMHGTGDDNVHYQGAEALINKLVEHGKHFTMMAYPNRSHGIYEGRGTTRHVYGYLTRYLMDHMPPGPR
ncbi:MAG: S9 family peptidase [Gemmatimonadota bacterium]|nr:S9 family peptidase [Gemmatimonadota bacterium]